MTPSAPRIFARINQLIPSRLLVVSFQLKLILMTSLARAMKVLRKFFFSTFPSVETTVYTLIDVGNETSKHHFLKSVK